MTDSKNKIPILLTSLDILSELDVAELQSIVVPYGDRHNIDFLFLNGIMIHTLGIEDDLCSQD